MLFQKPLPYQDLVGPELLIDDSTIRRMTSITAQWNESREAMEKSIADFEVKRKELANDRTSSSVCTVCFMHWGVKLFGDDCTASSAAVRHLVCAIHSCRGLQSVSEKICLYDVGEPFLARTPSKSWKSSCREPRRNTRPQTGKAWHFQVKALPFDLNDNSKLQ